MKLTWSRSSDSTETDVTWTLGSFVVTAVQYDTGEWVIRYGDVDPTTLYTRNLFTRDAALREARACMRDLTTQFIEERKETA